MGKWLIRFAWSVLAVFVLGLIALGIEARYTLSTREETMHSFVRMACRNAIVGIQTTEQTGLDNFSAQDLRSDIGLFTGKFDGHPHPLTKYKTDEQQEYTAYLTTLYTKFVDDMTVASDTEDKDAAKRLKLIQTFLNANRGDVGDSTNDDKGNEMFRPIQFGMTYVSPTMFKGAFIQALKELLEANGGRTEGTPLAGEPADSIYINWNDVDSYITVTVSEPKTVNLPKDANGEITDPTLISLYGIDKAQDLIGKLDSSLGFGDASVDFYVYYDISISVDWKSTLNSQVTNYEFLQKFGVQNSGDNFDANGFARISGKTITYNYRYVLTN